MLPTNLTLDVWLDELATRHLASLTFQEVRRGVQALSDIYVQRRPDLTRRALDGAGKRAGFALFYAPLHYLLTAHVLEALDAPAHRAILDLGCGTGAAGAAWCRRAEPSATFTGVEQNTWAAAEARWNLARLGVPGQVVRGNLLRHTLPQGDLGIVLAFTVNELGESDRNSLCQRLGDAVTHGADLLVLEPIAKTPVPWFHEWVTRFAPLGGREDAWKFPVTLPARLREMDRAAGLDHQVLKGRTLWVNGRAAATRPR